MYRLAPADGPLDEATFNKLPLEFVEHEGKQQGFRWGGGPDNGGSEFFFNGTYATEGTTPPGSKVRATFCTYANSFSHPDHTQSG